MLVDAWYKMEKRQVRKTAKAKMIDGLSEHELILLKFSKSEAKHVLSWQHSEEFVFNNQFYDIVKTAETEDSISYLCWLDKAETELNYKLDRYTNYAFMNHGERSDKTIYFGQLIKLHFLPNLQPSLTACFLYALKSCHGEPAASIHQGFFSHSSPPPRFA